MSSSFDNGNRVPAFHTSAYARSGQQLKVVVGNHVLGSSQPKSPLSEKPYGWDHVLIIAIRYGAVDLIIVIHKMKVKYQV
ncbi:hypothetical protein AM501_06175 [Aneurinibacillus migulanus]|uniref:Uncharacterized protein n=1 Tax=Aneurinibacillus migulanus TaxID=47500 RepID=A0A0D1Y3S2_ANEMI|nr:hypothetical protein [Aneurinibacillus migulanus]KIV50946.1 hypothetical protein TS64_25660 [Aneurinibacillus migulanus]KIV58998.1 hypothetical protein TS65_03415 [Aneurinibacillus migulanus]KON99299.1 hypothetical protein AF333_00765 [Aneurinibacillus migulanus]KPD09089.1 hypothetical protein AM501_06175 [Aneurinibacillus migulanus]MCP1354994.1 hypothetical protein [Aneurinibacillus migulanus]